MYIVCGCVRLYIYIYIYGFFGNFYNCLRPACTSSASRDLYVVFILTTLREKA